MKRNYIPSVIVGLNDASLSIVRSLGRKGVRIIGLYDDNFKEFYINSKYVSVKLKRQLEGEALIDTLINEVAEGLIESAVLFCTNDNSVLTVSQYEGELRPFFKFVLPPFEVTNTQISKKEFHKFAIENSFLVPNTFFVKGADEIGAIIESITFPCVIKPEFRDRMWYENVPVKVLFAESKNNVFDFMKQFKIQQTSLVIQEWVEGDDTEIYFCLTYISQNHKLLALCVGRKLCQHPHLTGSTSIAETIWLSEVVEESIRLLTTAGCVGFCSVEFKKSKRNGRFYVTEPTVGRPDTQEGIFLSSGLDAPYIAYLDALGHNLDPLGNAKIGIKWINEPLAFYSFQKYLQNSFDIKGFLSVCKGKRSYALWSFDDPTPAFSFYKEKIMKSFKRLFRSIFG